MNYIKKTQQIALRIPTDIVSQVDQIAKNEERSRSQVIIRLIKKALKDA